MSHYEYLRRIQLKEEKRQDKNDKRIHTHFIGSLKPSDESIIEKLKARAI